MRPVAITSSWQSLSIALRMTIWYALSTFALVTVTTGLLYSVLVRSLYDEDFRDMADNLNNARILLGTLSSSEMRQPADIHPPWALPHQPEFYLRLLDQNAKTLVETPGMTSELLPPSKGDLDRVPMPDGRKQELVSRSGKPFFTLIVRIPGTRPKTPPLFLEAGMDREHDRILLGRYREKLWWVLGISLVLSSVVGYLIARGGMRPIKRIAKTAEHIGSTTLHERIDRAGLPAELSGLAETFNTMLDRLQETFQRISQFSDDVAHELRTPINNLRGEIEVALTRVRSGDEYREILGSSLEECTRISRLIESLLFLARTEGDVERLEGEAAIDVSREVATVLEFYEAAAAESGVALTASASEGLSLEMDRTLFQQAIGNLVSNAIRYSESGGSVDVRACADHRQLIVTVTDSGCGIAAEHLPRLFDRFYRIDPARTNSHQNVGLGLAVVKSIIVRYGGEVEIGSNPGQGTQVKLILPLPR